MTKANEAGSGTVLTALTARKSPRVHDSPWKIVVVALSVTAPPESQKLKSPKQKPAEITSVPAVWWSNPITIGPENAVGNATSCYSNELLLFRRHAEQTVKTWAPTFDRTVCSSL